MSEERKLVGCKVNQDDFLNISKEERKKLDDLCQVVINVKECGRCHREKPLNEFGRHRDGYLYSFCKKCINKIASLRRFRKEKEILKRLCNLKCQKCGKLLINLPSAEGHHPKDKNFSLRDIIDRPLEVILNRVKSENIKIFCGNCHRMETATLFRRFKDFICAPNLFLDDDGNYEYADIIYRKIDLLLLKHNINRKKRKHLKYNLKCWFRKRSAFEQFFSGQCLGCGKVTITELASIINHHTEPLIKEDEKRFFTLPSLSKIFKAMIKERVVHLCCDCHRLITAKNFIDLIDEIFEDDNLSEEVKEIKTLFNQIKNNIDDFIDNFQNVDIIDHLQSNFGFRNSKEKYIIHLDKLSKYSLDGYVTSSALAKSLDLTREAVNTYFDRYLLNSGLVSKESGSGSAPNRYKLTKKAEKIIKSNQQNIKKYWFILNKINSL